MNLTSTQKFNLFSGKLFSSLRTQSSTYTTVIIVSALFAFEFFNFSSTDFALRDIFGDQGTGLLSWSTILALAFCGLDFAGIARLLAPQPSQNKTDTGSWFLLGAWVLAAAMNTAFTWWGISVAVYNHPVDNALIMDPMVYVTVVPVVVAVMVWCIRILIIGTLVATFSRQSAGSQPSSTEKQTSALGFKPSRPATPPGYQPIPNRASAQHQQ